MLARRRFSFGMRKPVTGWILLIRILPPVAFIIPLYIIFGKLGILETRLPIILACILINLPLVIWFMLTFFKDIPEEVEESAKMDGASEWQIFYNIILPLVLPGIAAVAMLSFMYSWNEYTYSVILTRSPRELYNSTGVIGFEYRRQCDKFRIGFSRGNYLIYSDGIICIICTKLSDQRPFKRRSKRVKTGIYKFRFQIYKNRKNKIMFREEHT